MHRRDLGTQDLVDLLLHFRLERDGRHRHRVGERLDAEEAALRPDHQGLAVRRPVVARVRPVGPVGLDLFAIQAVPDLPLGPAGQVVQPQRALAVGTADERNGLLVRAE